MNNFWTRIISGIFMIAFVVFVLFQPPWGIFLLALIIGVGSHHEWLKLKGQWSINQLTVNLLVFLVILFSAKLWDLKILFSVFGIALSLMIWDCFKKKSLNIFWPQLYISVPMLLFTFIPSSFTGLPIYNVSLPIFLMVLVWSSDSWAYVAGKLFGKHKLAPSISPGKTWEGFIGGTILSGLTGYFFVQFFLAKNGGLLGSDSYHPFGQISGCILGALVSIFGTMGDLFESSLKRKAGVKDSGNVLPGHGGMLDRFDAFLFAVVVYSIVCIIQ